MQLQGTLCGVYAFKSSDELFPYELHRHQVKWKFLRISER
jgi:hypothetical protein